MNTILCTLHQANKGVMCMRRFSWSMAVTVGAAGVLMLACLVMATSVDAEGDDGGPQGPAMYEVTLTNLNSGQPLSQPIVWTHTDNYRLFTLGEPASLELKIPAEEGYNQPLFDALKANHNVLDIQRTTVFPDGALRSALITDPGFGSFGPKTAKFTLRGDGKYRFVTVATMLGVTNDTFTAVTIPLPATGTVEAFGIAYDAGTEKNTEQWKDIPCGQGPSCVTNPYSPNPAPDPGTEGYVFVAAGIQGIADIPKEIFDWKNPVALVSVKRIR